MSLFKKNRNLKRPMLTCEQVNQFIVDYLDGRLSATTQKEFEQHLTMCPSCTPFLEQYKQTIQLVHNEGQIEVPPGLAEHTLAFLKEHLGGH